MFEIPRAVVERLQREYPPGTRVELIEMNDPYRYLSPGELGSVIGVDAIGTIHVRWDCGSDLGIAYGEDRCRKVASHD